MESKIEKLSSNLINHSVHLKEGEKILIEMLGTDCSDLACELVNQARRIGAIPIFNIIDYKVLKEIILNCNEESINEYAKYDLARMKDVDAYIGIRAANPKELDGIAKERMEIYNKYYQIPVHFEERVKNTKWCILRYPNEWLANKAKMSLKEFTDFFFKVCTIDYSKMEHAMEPLKVLLSNTKNVHIKGPGTNLTFSVEGIPAEKYYGTFNIPDGEFAFGLNPYVKNTMGDVLFDEKVAGSFHFTPGTALEKSDNGNRSNIHWDIVCIQTPEYGGGEIYFDDVLIRKDGKFVLEELKPLNPENLI